MADHASIDHTGITGAGSPTEITSIPTAETDAAKVLAPDGAGGVEFRAEAGSGAGAISAFKYDTAGGNKSTTSTTQADVDATNAVVAGTVPASGNFLIIASFTVNMSANNQNAFVGLREGTTDVLNGIFACQGQAGFNLEALVAVRLYVTGATPGSHTYKLAFKVNGGATFTIRASASSPLTLSFIPMP